MKKNNNPKQHYGIECFYEPSGWNYKHIAYIHVEGEEQVFPEKNKGLNNNGKT